MSHGPETWPEISLVSTCWIVGQTCEVLDSCLHLGRGSRVGGHGQQCETVQNKDFLSLGVPVNHIFFFFWIFHHNPSILGYTPWRLESKWPQTRSGGIVLDVKPGTVDISEGRVQLGAPAIAASSVQNQHDPTKFSGLHSMFKDF